MCPAPPPASQPLEASSTALSPGNKDKRANSKAGTAGVCCLEIRRVCLKFSLSMLTEEGRLGWRGVILQSGEKRWVMECSCRALAFSAKVSSGPPTQLGPPHSSLSIPIPAPAQDPLVEPNSPSLFHHPQPTHFPYPASPGFSQQCPLPPALLTPPGAPVLALLSQGTHSASTSFPAPQPWCPSSQCAAQEKNTERRLSGHWEQAEGGSWG